MVVTLLLLNLPSVAFKSTAPGAASEMRATQARHEQKKPLTHAEYDGWKSIPQVGLSEDGTFLYYELNPEEGDGELKVYSTSNPVLDKPFATIARGSAPQITHDSHFLIATQIPRLEESKKAKRDKLKPEDSPKNSLIILDLRSGKVVSIPKVEAYSIAKKGSDWLAYQVASGAKPEKKDEKKPEIPPGKAWVLRNLQTGNERTLADLTEVAFDESGGRIAYAVSTLKATDDGVFYQKLEVGKPMQIVAGKGRYSHLSFSKDGSRLAFITDKDDVKAKTPLWKVFAYEGEKGQLAEVAAMGTTGLPKDFVPVEGTLRFSDDSRRLFFPTRAKPAAPVKSDVPDDEKANLDIWNWKDERIQTEQLVQLKRDQERTYEAVATAGSKEVVELESPALRSVAIGNHLKADFGIGESSVPYQKESSWDPGAADLYRVNAKTGQASKLLTGFRGDQSLSPNGKFDVIYDAASATYSVIKLETSSKQRIGADITFPLNDEEHDTPDLANSYGIGGFCDDGHSAIIYDRYDIWKVDLEAGKRSQCLTGGFGRRTHIILRLAPANVDPESLEISLGKPLFVAAQSDETEEAGYYKLAGHQLTRLIFGEHSYPRFVKSKNGNKIIYSEGTFNSYPNLWLTDGNWSEAVQVSDANPQQSQYRWGSAELVRWIGNDGQALKGILYKPEGFDRNLKYPMITYYYEKDSNRLFQYSMPAPSASTINIPYFVSNGYVVFVPDISYKTGYPGASAYSAIIPGVQSILAQGFVDPKRLGLQGQSWGGYETAYLVTRSTMFAAASSGAPVGDMFSAYGGIRYGTGIVRQFQYEHTQSRIGGTIWDRPLQYLENSPIFALDRVETPLLIMSNDEDGSVPHTQGIELFVDLRRLQKPSWLLVYNHEDHNIVQRKNRKDLSVRLGQFFDHYLKGAPMPKWMDSGVPAIDKGKDYGFELQKR